jgi:hypothetical protein
MRRDPSFNFCTIFQRDILAHTLQNPDVFSRLSNAWSVTYFDAPQHRQIANAYYHIKMVGREQPTKASIVQELTKEWHNDEYPVHVKDALRELDVLYDIPVANIEYTIEEVRSWAKDHALLQVIEASINLIGTGKPENILEIVQKAFLVGDDIGLAGDDFFRTEPELPPVIIAGVLRAESIGIMSSSSKSYKTWNLLAAAIATATGKSWMGFESSAPVRVLYCNLELHPEELKLRIDKVAVAMGTTRSALQGRVDFLNLKGQCNKVDKVLARIRMMRDANDPWRLCLIDPIYKLYSGDDSKESSENNASAMGALFEKLEGLAKQLEMAILLAHHFRKGNQGNISDIDLGSGSGVFARAPDAMIYLRELQDEEQAWKCCTILRYFPPVEPFGVRLGTGDQWPLIIRDQALDLTKEAGKPGAKTKYCVEQVVALLPVDGLTNKTWQDLSSEKICCGPTTFSGLKKDAIDRGFVMPSGENLKRDTLFVPTAEGRSAVQRYQLKDKIRASSIARNGNSKGTKKSKRSESGILR